MKTYTCPMHPEVQKTKPGRCPKCGMELEKQEHAQEHASMEESFKKRFFFTIPLTLLVVLLSPNIQKWFGLTINIPASEIISFLLASAIVFWSALPFYQMAASEVKTKAFAMMTLVSLAVLSGYTFSVAATFLFPGESLYWEVSTLVLAFLFGHWMEMRAIRGATGALSELAKLIPPTAHRISGKTIEDVQTEDLQKEDIVQVKPGEKIPIDGEVIAGQSSVNESNFTGESRPIEKNKGDLVIGGTINQDGSLTVKVTKTGGQTAIAQMIELVRQAQESKPPVQRLADQAAKVLTFTAVFVGISTFIYWFLINPQGAIFAATLAIAVVVIACPHALGLAIPTVTVITTSLAAKNGILIRDMGAVEIAKKINLVIFDKTGTLTQGKFGVTSIIQLSNVSSEAILRLTAAVEFYSQHSIAQGILEEAKNRKINYVPAKNFQSFPGRGATGVVLGKKITIGNQALMEQKGISVDKFKDKIKTMAKEGKTFIWVAQGKEPVGLVVLEDIIRRESKRAIDALHKMGIKTAILTGDNEAIAASVAKKLGIDTYFAQVLPEDKVNKIRQLQEGNIVAMVGDGVNDAPSLTQAHVGIAIGAGTDVAIESAQMVLVKNDPQDVVRAIKLSQKTNTKMRENLAWATGYNLITIPIAAGALYSFGILLRPEWAALLMSASSIIVVINALSLRRVVLTV